MCRVFTFVLKCADSDGLVCCVCIDGWCLTTAVGPLAFQAVCSLTPSPVSYCMNAFHLMLFVCLIQVELK